jgi:hypothetical protein
MTYLLSKEFLAFLFDADCCTVWDIVVLYSDFCGSDIGGFVETKKAG